MPRSLDHLDAHVPQRDNGAVAHGLERVFSERFASEANRRACAIAQLEMSGEEVRVEVREKNVGDTEMVLRSERQILIDVSLRIDDRGCAARLVADEVRCVGKAVQIELL